MDVTSLIEPSLGILARDSQCRKGIQGNLTILREDAATEFDAVIYNPVICLILQGAKVVTMGAEVTHLSAGEALLVSHHLPVQSRITKASAARPYLALIISIDLSLIRSLYELVGSQVREGPDAHCLSRGTAEPELIGAISRYLDIQNKPLEASVLGRGILREIHFRLLISPIGGMLRSLLSIDSHASRVSRAILKLRSDFRQNLAVAELAQEAGMSQSSFHSHFKNVTGTTPLQYQKDLRMIAARDLLRSGTHSVSAASFEVGYESSTHFTRDYQRKFGRPPSKEALVGTEQV
jgi:AraC-like DNA-binding protein